MESITGTVHSLRQADRLWGLRRNAQRACDAGVVSVTEKDAWIRDLERLDAQSAFFSSLSGFLACGRVPEEKTA